MVETKFQCPHCGRVGSTTKTVPPGATALCPACRGSFKIEGSSPAEPGNEPKPEPVHPTLGPAAGIDLTSYVPPAPPSGPSVQPAQPPLTSPTVRWPRRRMIALSAAAGSVLVLVAIGVGWFVFRSAGPPPPAAAVVLTTEEVTARCEASVAFVSGPSGSGTGFLVADGLLATNAHVIDSTPAEQIRITFPAAPELDRGPILGQVVYFDPARDLAMLKVSTRLRPIDTDGGHVFRRGQDVVVIGNPGVGGRSLECVVSRGVLGSKVVETGRSYYQLSGSINPGNSGGPVIDLAGRVVGVVVSKAAKQEGLAFCIPAADLASMTHRALTQSEAAARAATMDHTTAVRSAEAAQRIADVMIDTDPATWIAMADVNRVLDDDSPEASATRSVLNRVDELYAEDRRTIAFLVLKVVALAKDSGNPISAREVLTGSLEWATPHYFNRGHAVEFSEYAKLYALYHGQNKTHDATMASVRAHYRATVGTLEPKPEPVAVAPRPSQDLRGKQRRPPNVPTDTVASAAPVTVPDPEPTPSYLPPVEALAPKSSSLALMESLRLGRSLEQQKKIRGALCYYRDLVEDYPGTSEADQAAERLAILTRPPSFGDRPPAKVLEVPDERTVVVDLGGSRTSVRLLGLDPLPTRHSVSPRGPWEAQARDFLRGLVEGRAVHLDYERGVSQSDGRGHTLAYLYRADDMLPVNREMIARGYAIGTRFGTMSQAEDFRDADARARSRKVGLWAP